VGGLWPLQGLLRSLGATATVRVLNTVWERDIAGAAALRCRGRSGGYNNLRVETSAGTARATSGLKPPPSRVCWLSESGEPSYELKYAAEGPGGGRLVEFMPLS
jgi:hypothetical protein